MNKITNKSTFDEYVAYWSAKMREIGEPGKESSIQAIAIDARLAENPVTYLNEHALDLYNRLTGGFLGTTQAPMDVDTSSTSAFTSETSSEKPTEKKSKEKEEPTDDEDPVESDGLFSSTLSEADKQKILGKGDDTELRAAIERSRREAQRPFNDASGTYSGKKFTFGGKSTGGSSAKRHIEAYIKGVGFPPGTSTVDDLRNSLLQAASALVDKGTLGSKGYNTKASYPVRSGFTWNLIITPVEGATGTYSIDHVDINGIYQ